MASECDVGHTSPHPTGPSAVGTNAFMPHNQPRRALSLAPALSDGLQAEPVLVAGCLGSSLRANLLFGGSTRGWLRARRLDPSHREVRLFVMEAGQQAGEVFEAGRLTVQAAP